MILKHPPGPPLANIRELELQQFHVQLQTGTTCPRAKSFERPHRTLGSSIGRKANAKRF
jgi:hypothetical protein